MRLTPCPGCGAKYAEGQIGTVHDSQCPELPQNQRRKQLLLELYEILKANPAAAKAINWEAFAKHALGVGLHYHPKLGLMTAEGWEVIKGCLVEPEALS